MAKLGGYNLVSRELGISRPYRSFYNQIYTENVPGIEEFMGDLNSVATSSESWVKTLLPSSGANEPEFPAQFHIEYGGVKKDESFSGTDLLVKDIDKADALFTDIESTMENAYRFKTDRQRYHNTSNPNIFLRKLENSKNVNDFVLRIAWSVFLWNSRKMEIAKTLADVLNRDITQHECQCIDGEMKVKGIGYNDYLN